MSGRTIVVTGGGTGIGRAAARHFAAAGERVWIVGRRADVLHATAAELGVEAVSGDLSTPEGAAAVAAGLPDRVDVLVNNAGGLGARPSGVDLLVATAAGWLASWTGNVLTAVLTTQALTDRLPDGGRVVTIGSIAGAQGAGDYGAAKAALESWNVGLARSLGPRGITANVVAPGVTEQTEFFGPGLTPERRARLVAATLTGRVGQPEDVVAAIVFLASPEARHITGQVLHVDGGAYHGR